jgi:hypothetical protein
MLVANGPFNSLIPFVNIQEIRINTNVEGNLVVSLGISNETSTPTDRLKFGNYVLMSPQKSVILNAAKNIPLLIKSIKRDAEGRIDLILNQEDFKPKISTNNPSIASQQVYSYVHEITRVVEGSDDLYVMVVSYTNYEDEYTIGNITTDKILAKKKLPDSAKLYTLSETVPSYGAKGSIWPAAAHIHNKKIMAGPTHTKNNHPFITSQPVLNVKSKDMRVIKLAQSLHFGEQLKNPQLRASYFSNLTLSRNSHGAMTGLFSFDHLRFAMENTKFGRLIKNNKTLLTTARVKDIVVYQKIVVANNTGNELTPGQASYSALADQGTKIRIAALNQGLKITSTLNNNSVLNISFEDPETQDLVGNMVEYSVEVLLDDETGSSLKSVVERISTAVPRYQSPNPPPYKDIIDLYLASIQVILGSAPFRTLTASMWQKSLISLTAATGLHATEDRGTVLETIREFANKLNKALVITQSNSTANPNHNSKIYASSHKSGPTATHMFADRYHIKDAAGYGLDYLEAYLVKGTSPLPALSYEGIKTRSNNEIQKYNIENPTANNVNTVGYLSPESVKMGPDLNPISTDTLQNSNDNFVSIVRSTKETNLVVSLEPDKDLATDKEETLALEGIAFSANASSLRKMVFDTAIVSPPTSDSSTYLSDDSNFATVTTPEEASVSGSTESIAHSREQTDRPVTAPVVTALVDRTITEFQVITGLTNTNNIQGSIALTKAEQSGDLIEESDAMTNILNFGSLVQVQYLDQYSRQLGVKKQNWRLLTEKIVRDASSNNRTLLCRLVSMANTINTPSIIQLGTLSSLFTLGPGFANPTFPSFATHFNTILTGMTGTNNLSLKEIDSVATLYATNMLLSQKIIITTDPDATQNTDDRPGRRRPRPIGGLRY